LSNASPNLIAPAGQVSLLSDHLILVPLKESKSLPSVPNVEKVSTVCALISFALMSIDVMSGNFIGLRSSAPAWNVSPSTQLSAGHCV